MKKLLFTIACVLTSIASEAQVADSIKWQKLSSNMYCISPDAGLTHEGKAITEDVRLNCGATLSTKGNITWSDKSQTKLSSGYCVDESGAIYAPGNSPEQKKKTTANVH